MEDVTQHAGSYATDLAQPTRVASRRSGGLGRRAARQRVESGANGRDVGIAQALRRLEREHIALLMAICELDGQGAIDEAEAEKRHAMNEALLVLLRDDLTRTQHALALAAEGRYGACEECERPLSRRDLELMPATTRCAVCEAEGRRAARREG